MTEDEARAWFEQRYPSDVVAKLDCFAAMLRDEAAGQSLIARSTFDEIWVRHMLDSAQVADLGVRGSPWLDIGSGGGLPGIVLAILHAAPITLVEPRRLRADFLIRARDLLALTNVTVAARKVQHVTGHYAVVTARAVAPIAEIFGWTQHLVSRETAYLLPRGRSAADELANASRAWHGTFHVEQSITQSDSGIIVAAQVRPK